jgi:DNA polymerase-1
MKTDNPPIILVDASSYLFRAFHAMPPLMNSKGQATGAIYGVVNMMKKLFVEYKPRYLAMVFDAKGKTFRDDMYSEYKANRPPMPDELRSQIEPLHALIRSMGVPLIVEPGVEADDVIGTLACRFANNQNPVLVSTGDKDLAQLVNDNITLINTMNNHLSTPTSVVEKFGVRPDQIQDYLALMGDSSDNIPGIPKVGPKTAAKWLQTYENLENLINNANELGGKVGESFRDNLELLILSSKLVKIQCQLDIKEELQDIQLQSANNIELLQHLQHLEFNSWQKELLAQSENDEELADNIASMQSASKVNRENYQVILNKADLKLWLDEINHATLTAIDTETTSIDAMQAKLVGISLATAAGKACYIPLTHCYMGVPEQLDKNWVLEQLTPWLEDPQHQKVGQNLKYDYQIFANENIILAGISDDTMLQSYTLDSTANRHDMNTLALKYLDHHCIHFEDIAGKGKKQLTFDQISLEEAAPYAAEDADVTLQLHLAIKPLLEKIPTLNNLYNEIEIPLLSVIAEVERNGVLVDATALQKQSIEMSVRLGDLEKQAFELAETEFNLSSPKQLQQILFENMQLPVLKKTPKGQPSTAEEVLQELALDYPLPKLILEHRTLSKLKSTYTDKLPLQINPQTGRVHTSYHQAVTATGRLSSSDPNLQNIPIRSEQGRRIRQAFIAKKGNKLIAADYSQIELRIMAHLSADPGLMHAFNNDLDVHRATAAEVFDVAAEAVTTDQRRSAKAINFGLIYGMSAFGLAKQLGVGREEAQHYMHRYFARYPGVESYMEKIKENARQKGYVETLFGRRLYLPQINAKNGLHRAAAERTAINAPMQGTAADIIKKAMLNISTWIEQENIPLVMIMQVHDELVFEVPEDQANDLAAKIADKMEQATELNIPLKVDVGIGMNWDEAH